jgi:two-component system, LuxR family, sensor kinase FixL
MGIGLSVSNSIIEAHYGRIWVESRTAGEPAFNLTLPSTTTESEE